MSMTDAKVLRVAKVVFWACMPLSVLAVLLQLPAVAIGSTADRVPLHTLGSLNLMPLATVVLGIGIFAGAAGALLGQPWGRWVVAHALWLAGLAAGFELLFVLFLLFQFGLPSPQVLPFFLGALAGPVLVGATAFVVAAFLNSRRVVGLFKSGDFNGPRVGPAPEASQTSGGAGA
jgi:hypothetical protein